MCQNLATAYFFAKRSFRVFSMGFIRVLLSLVVVLSHAPAGVLISKFLHPGLAVQCFYAISGFYMQLLVWDYSKNSRSWVKRFYISRLMRLLPIYYVCLLITFAIRPNITSPLNLLAYYSELLTWDKILYLTDNLFVLPQSVLPFFGKYYTVMWQSWTLSLEMIFYLLCPFLLTKNSRTVLLFLILSLCIRLTLRVYGFYEQAWFISFFPNELAIFLAGSLGFRFYNEFLEPQNVIADGALTLIGFCFLIFLAYFYKVGWLHFEGGEWKAVFSCGSSKQYLAALAVTIISIPFIFKWSKNFRFDRWMGDLSYPIYLSHTIFIELLSEYAVAKEYIAVVTVVLTFIFAILLCEYVDKPISKWRYALKRKGSFIGSGLKPGDDYVANAS